MGHSEAMPCFTLDGRGKWRQQLKSFACICYYYVSSMGLILYNKWLFKKFGFAYPLSVTALHFTLCFLFACIWVRSREGSFCSIGSSMVMRRTVIIGVLTGIDVSLSNLSYLMVSIPFMEMVKSSSPVFVVLLSFATGIEKPSFTLAAAMLLMSAGLALSVEGEMNFNVLGFVMCLGAGFLSALRLVLSHTVLHGRGTDGLDSISLLYIAAPSSAFVILPIALPVEAVSMIQSDYYTDASLFSTTLWSVLAGGFLAINLNVSEFVLVGQTSALTMNVAGILKVVAVSALSVILFQSKISVLNICGYLVCVVGVGIYNSLKFREETQVNNFVDGEALLVLDEEEGTSMLQTSLQKTSEGCCEGSARLEAGVENACK